jgi:hypothetical protein
LGAGCASHRSVSRWAFPEKDVEDDVPGEGIGTESPKTHLIEYLRNDSVEGPAPVEPEQEKESLGLDGAAEALELAEKRGGGAEAGGGGG